MRKIVALLLAVMMVLSLAACGTAQKPAEPAKTAAVTTAPATTAPAATAPAATPAAKSKVTLWNIGTTEIQKGLMKDAIARFNKKFPNVEVEHVATENDPYKTKVKIAVGSGNPPDLFHSWGGGWLEAFVNEGIVEDLTPYLDKDKAWKDTYFPAFLDMAKFNGKNYGVPTTMGGVMVFYNKDLFKKYNVAIPKTFTDFKKVCKTFIDNKIIPLAIGNASKWPGALEYEYVALRLGGYETFMNAYLRKPGASFDAPTYIEAGKKIQELVDMGAYPVGMNGINYDTGGSRALFYTEKAAMQVQTLGLMSNTKSEAPDFFKNKLGFFTYPMVEGGKGDPTEVLGGENALSLTKASKSKDMAVELLKFVTDKEMGQGQLDKAAQFAPVQGITISDPMLKELFDTMNKAKNVQMYYDQFLPPEMGTLLNDTVQGIFGKTVTPEAAAKTIEAKAKEVLKAK